MQLSEYQNSAHEISQKIQDGSLSLGQVGEFYLHRAARLGDKLNAFITFDQDYAATEMSRCQKVIDQAKKSGQKLRLAGVPVVIKDNISTHGLRTTCSSKILDRFKPIFDATVIERLKAQGAWVLAKANCDEFAMGSSNENSAYGPVKNPWDLNRVPGGSSGGSAAAVAADIAPISLGSDTGGSIRQPASLCGIVGLKPTYGRVSRYGLVAYGSSLDQIGPFSRNVLDSCLVTDVISGHDPRDSTSANQAHQSLADYISREAAQNVAKPLQGLKIGCVKEFFGDGLEGDVRRRLMEATEVLKKLGAEMVDVSLPNLKYSIATYYVLATAEASSNLARYDGMRYGYRADPSSPSLDALYKESRSRGFGREVKQRIMLGTFVLSSGYYDAYYNKAVRVRQKISDDFSAAFSRVDVLLSPTSPTTAFKIGEKADDPIAMYLSDICTLGVNLAGIPGISVPCGFDAKGLPVGLQLMAPRFTEAKLIKGAYFYERETRWWSQRRPELA